MSIAFADGVLFFPVTPFGTDGSVDTGLAAELVSEGVDHGAGGVFAACGTGEYHALSVEEGTAMVSAAVRAAAGRVPVLAGAGGPLGHAIASARAARDAGAQGLLVMPPYLVQGPQAGIVAYVEAVAAAAELPVIVYHRANASLTGDSVTRLLENPLVAGIKEGVGDVARMQEFVRLAAGHDLGFFNGLLTAEASQAAYAAIGVTMYSSAAFAMAPEVATAFYTAHRAGDRDRQDALLDGFFQPLVRLRDETPGFAVSLIKAGLRLRGRAVGSVRPPLVDPASEQERRLEEILDRGRALAG